MGKRWKWREGVLGGEGEKRGGKGRRARSVMQLYCIN